MAGRDHPLDHSHAGPVRVVADIALDVDREARGAPWQRGLEDVIGSAADRVVVGGVLGEPGDLRLPERTGGRVGQDAGSDRGLGLTIGRREPVANRVLGASPVEGHRSLTGNGPVDLVRRERATGHRRSTDNHQRAQPVRSHSPLTPFLRYDGPAMSTPRSRVRTDRAASQMRTMWGLPWEDPAGRTCDTRAGTMPSKSLHRLELTRYATMRWI